jgi:RNA polymerase sigma factor (sigma-70 family)
MDLDALYRRHAPGALRLAWLLTGEQEEARDLVHDAFVRSAGRLLRNEAAFGAYLRRCIVNLALNRARRDRLSRTRLPLLAPPEEAAAVEMADGVGLHDALRRLPIQQRTALVARFYLDLSEAQTAELMGCRPGTVKSAVSRGLAALRMDDRLTDGEARNG